MKIKVYTIDFQLPRWVKKGLLVTAAVVAVGLGAAVWAAVDVDTSTIAATQPISAGVIKKNFDNLAAAVNALQAPIQVLTASAGTAQTLTASTDGVYGGTYLDLPPGTWLIQGQASMLTTGAVDLVRLALYNATSSQVLSASKSSPAETPALGYPVAVSTALTLLSVSSITRIQLYGYRNGSSTLTFGNPAAATATMAADAMRITAFKLSQ